MKFEKLEELRVKAAIAKVLAEAPEWYARTLAEEMGLKGEERYLFIARVERANSVSKFLTAIGATTVFLTPYILAKALTR